MISKLKLVVAAALFLGSVGRVAFAAEEPKYSVVRKDQAIQIREYGELLVAQTRVEGDYDDVGGAAFRRLAGFIFGDNDSREKVAMTAPVLQEPASRTKKGEKIAMTAPVLQEPAGDSANRDAWVMTFVMPAEYTLETLPVPRDPKVEIRTLPPKRVATIRFSGLMNKKKYDRYTAELVSWIDENGYVAISPPRSAGYNPPWTLPPLRRNEIHIDVE